MTHLLKNPLRGGKEGKGSEFLESLKTLKNYIVKSRNHSGRINVMNNTSANKNYSGDLGRKFKIHFPSN